MPDAEFQQAGRCLTAKLTGPDQAARSAESGERMGRIHGGREPGRGPGSSAVLGRRTIDDVVACFGAIDNCRNMAQAFRQWPPLH